MFEWCVMKSRLLALLCGVALLLGCQRTSEPPAPAREVVAFKHYFSFGGAYAGTVDTIAKRFDDANTRYRLQVLPVEHETFKRQIRSELAEHRPADLYSYWAGARVASILDQLEPIDDVLPPAEMNKLFGPAIVKSASVYDGRVYFLPIAQHYVAFVYNKKVFSALGLQPPKTWPELVSLAKRLKANGVTPFALGSKARWPAQFWFDYLLLRTAPLEYRQRLMDGRASFDDPEVRRVFDLWRELLQAGLFNAKPNELEFDSRAGLMVRRGEAAMTLMGTWLTGFYESPEVNWHEGEDFGFFPFPQIDPSIAPVALGPIDGLVLPREAKHPNGAKAVMRQFALAGSQVEISRAMGALAPNLLVLDRHYSPSKQVLRDEIARNHAWAFNYDLATPPERAEIGLNLFAAFVDAPEQATALLKQTAAQMAKLPPPAPKTPH